MKLKVCGMRETKNITALANLQPDYMGFIFWEPSQRYCTTVPSDIPKTIKKVGVFVDETTEQIKEKVKLFGLDAVQLHGDESPSQCAALLSSCEVIKAFRLFMSRIPVFLYSSLCVCIRCCTNRSRIS